MTLDIQEVQEQLTAMKLDGWLLYDFQGLNPIARKLLGLQDALLTRRWFCWIPSRGPVTLLCHRIERQGFEHLPAPTVLFSSWEEMQAGLERLLQGSTRVAMEYSPHCYIPYVSRVDAGTLELVRSLGKTVVSSADLVQYFEARWSRQQLQTHLQASRLLMEVLFETFQQVGEASRNRVPLDEHQLQQSMCQRYRERGLESSSPPIVAVNQNSGNPHYEPRAGASAPIRTGDLLLIDFWAKLSTPQAVYADYTWVAFLGESLPAKVVRVWDIVREARDRTLEFVRAGTNRRTAVRGWEVDEVARQVISRAGFGEYFIHRTGHSIGESDHGNGANMDGLETRDERLLIPRTCFSIEPGVYLPDFGIRSEVNVYLGEEELVVTGDPIQQEIRKI